MEKCSVETVPRVGDYENCTLKKQNIIYIILINICIRHNYGIEQ